MSVVSIVLLVLGLLFILIGIIVLYFLWIFQIKKTTNLKRAVQIEINSEKLQWKLDKQKKDKIWKENKTIQNQELKKREDALLLTEKKLKKKTEEIKEKLATLDDHKESLLTQKKEIFDERKKIIVDLEKVSGLSQKEALKELLKNVKKNQSQKLQKVVKDKIDETKKLLDEKVNNLLASAIERTASDFVTEKTVSKVIIKDEEIKGKIIGKEGRNINSFKELSGTDLVLEKDNQIIKIVSYNPIRREIATRALNILIEDGRIQPERIQNVLKAEEAKLDQIIKKTGEDVVNQLGITDLSPKLIFHLGKLKYRTSYGQNVLQHSIEVAKFAGNIAKELGLDDELAMRAGLLHDIGKSIDYEVGKSHVLLGVELATENEENDIVINAIHAHHEDVPKNNVYSYLVSTADTLSAALPGARNNTHDDFVKRMENIEKICSSFPGVMKSYAFSSGRIIRVVVDAAIISDLETEDLADQIRQKLKENLTIPGNIKIEVLRNYKVTKNF